MRVTFMRIVRFSRSAASHKSSRNFFVRVTIRGRSTDRLPASRTSSESDAVRDSGRPGRHPHTIEACSESAVALAYVRYPWERRKRTPTAHTAVRFAVCSTCIPALTRLPDYSILQNPAASSSGDQRHSAPLWLAWWCANAGRQKEACNNVAG